MLWSNRYGANIERLYANLHEKCALCCHSNNWRWKLVLTRILASFDIFPIFPGKHIVFTDL